MGKLSKSIKKKLLNKKFDELEYEYLNDKNKYKELIEFKDQDTYSDECSSIISDYENVCKETSANKVKNITKYYDNCFKNGINEFKEKVKKDLEKLNEFLKYLQSMSRNLRRCLNGRINYKYICLKLKDRDDGHNYEIKKGILYYFKLKEFIYELEKEIKEERDKFEEEKRQRREIRKEQRRKLEEQRRKLEEQFEAEEEIDEKDNQFYQHLVKVVDDNIRQFRQDEKSSSEEWQKIIYKKKNKI